MNPNLHIKALCKIDQRGVWLNGEGIWQADQPLDQRAYFKQLYELAGLDYPKYFKMDSLCKLGLVGAELLFKKHDLPELYAKDRVATVLQCHAASLDTDRKFYETIKDPANYYPSPAVFVYTLPSIVMGEIAIKHGLQGENCMFVAEHFDPEPLMRTVEEYFHADRAAACLVGWVNADRDHYDAMLFLVEHGPGDEWSEGIMSRLFGK